MDAAIDSAGQVPDQPGVDRPEQQIAGGGRGASLGAAVIEDPGQLERRGIGRDGQAGQCAEAVGAERIAGGQPLARAGRPRVLPDDRVVDRPPGPARPDDGRLALVADPDRGQRARIGARVTQRDPDAGPHALEDLLGIVLDPAGSRGDLGVLQLVAGDRPPGPVEQDAAAARRPLVDGGDERPRVHGRTSSGTALRSIVWIEPATSRICQYRAAAPRTRNADDPDHAVGQQRPEDPRVERVELDLAEEDEHAVHDRGRAAERREDHDQDDRHAEHERADGEDRADDQGDDDRDEARAQAEPLEEPDPEGIADGAAEDDDRRVVPEERDRREDDPEDETDAPRQDRREDAALPEHVLTPLRPGDEAEEEGPQREQDREQLQPVERPGETDADGQEADDDRL